MCTKCPYFLKRNEKGIKKINTKKPRIKQNHNIKRKTLDPSVCIFSKIALSITHSKWPLINDENILISLSNRLKKY